MSAQRGRPDLVIFDCDGVLVDTEPLAERAMGEALAEIGMAMSRDDMRQRFRGLSMTSVAKVLEELRGAPLPEGWIESLKERDFALFARELEAVPGVAALVQQLRGQGLAYCVASSGSTEKMRFTLGHTGLLPFFDNVLFSASMVARGKPFPDLFLFAAEHMGAAPGACVVIEDSVHGTTAGVAAGMRVLSYAGAADADQEALAQAGGTVFTAMDQVPALLQI